MRAVLVYQAGIANVFQVKCMNMAKTGRNARRLFQGDFYGAEQFARGLAASGASVASAACNMAGDIVNERWSTDLEEQPFSDKFRPVWNKVDPNN